MKLSLKQLLDYIVDYPLKNKAEEAVLKATNDLLTPKEEKKG